MNVNELVSQELQKPAIKKFKKRKVCARFKENIWAPDVAEVGSLSFKDRGVKYLLRVTFSQNVLGIKKLKQFFMFLLK